MAGAFTYDAAGNTASIAGVPLSYNQNGRLTSLNVNNAQINYLYNALGQMIAKSVGGVTTVLTYDEAGHLLGEYSPTTGLIQETVWMGDTPIATIQPTTGGSGLTLYYVHTDNLNTPRIITRPSDNTPMWAWTIDPFGTTAALQNPYGAGNFVYNLRFPGQYYQAETGIFQNYYRDYFPGIGRYLESDPIGLNRGSYSTYAYVGGNPVSLVDPYGLWSWYGAFNGASGGLVQGTVTGALVGALAGPEAAVPGAVLGGLTGTVGGFIAGGLADGGFAGAAAGAVGGGIGGIVGGAPGVIGGATGGAIAGAVGTQSPSVGALIGGISGGVAGAVTGGIEEGPAGAIAGGASGTLGGIAGGYVSSVAAAKAAASCPAQ